MLAKLPNVAALKEAKDIDQSSPLVHNTEQVILAYLNSMEARIEKQSGTSLYRIVCKWREGYDD